MSDEPWAWAVTWDGRPMPDYAGDYVDRIVFFDQTVAQDYADGLTLEEGDPEPEVVPLYPRLEVSKVVEVELR